MLTDYKNEKNKILTQYEKILNLPNILSKDITIENIKEKKKQLEEEHFFVSFTGQIKAGKSTLINALLFEEEIIPTDDTPHTAKITLIKYGKEPRIEATFYNKEEWKQLKSNKDFYEEFLKPDIEKSIGQGLFVDEIINTTAKIKNENHLDNLNDYVARYGKYTPFVNLVTIYHPNEILKEITIVDTPGTNDPNEQRDKVAKEWIHKTNANIYITYAGQAMDKVDIDFIDNFLLSVPKEQKLTVLNKIDSINDSDGLEEYISELLADTQLKRREVVSNKESLILVSALGALIDKMLNRKLTLNEDLEYYAEQLEEKGFLEPENHGLLRLEKMIEKKLIENKGKNIIDSHSKFLDSIFRKRINEIEQKLNEKKSSLSDLMKSKLELKNISESIDEIIKFIQKEKKKIDKNFNKLIKSNLDEFYLLQHKQHKISLEKIETEIKGITNSSNYQNEVEWIVKKAIDNNFEELRESLRDMTDKLTLEIQEDMDNLKYNLIEKDKNISLTLTTNTFSIYAIELTLGMKELAEKQFKGKKINKLIQKNTNSWQRFWDTENTLEGINSKIMKKINNFFEISDNNMREEFEDKIANHIQKNILENIINELNETMDKKENEIEEYLQNESNKENLIEEAKKERERLETELKSLNNSKKEIE